MDNPKTASLKEQGNTIQAKRLSHAIVKANNRQESDIADGPIGAKSLGHPEITYPNSNESNDPKKSNELKV